MTPAPETDNTVAVALSYEEGSAPQVAATGAGELAETILQIARENDIPIEQNPLLAAALSSVKLGEEIPEDLYKAVAAVISFILHHRPSQPPPQDQTGISDNAGPGQSG